MATKVVMEALSPTMEEGRLVEWKKNTGDAIAVGDVLAEVETDKAVMELVARAAGVLINQAVTAGTTVPVAGTVAWIGAAGEEIPGVGAQHAAPAAGNAASPRPPHRQAARRHRSDPRWTGSKRPGGIGTERRRGDIASASASASSQQPAADRPRQSVTSRQADRRGSRR